MTNIERMHRIFDGEKVDRLPAVHFGYWNELLHEWAEQGHISKEIAENHRDSNAYDRELNHIIGWDFNWQCLVGARVTLRPWFEREVLETQPDGTQRVKNIYGVIEKIKPGVSCIPAEDDYTLKSRKVFEEEYLPRMQYTPERLDEESIWAARKRCDENDTPLGLNLGSVMGDIRNMCSVIGMSYLLYDEDETLLSDLIDAYAEMQYQCAEAVLKLGVKFDFAHYWEDICFKGGPLLSPADFERLCAKHYRKRNDLCHRYGIKVISLDCDGVTEKLLPTWYQTGVNTMFPIEVGTWGDQFEPARRKFGAGMFGVGGMDKTALRKDKAAVDEEIARMTKLAALGGFIPCPDHRLMPGSKFELTQYYAEQIQKIRL